MKCLPQHCNVASTDLTAAPDTRTLRRALQRAGCLDDLAFYLGVPATLLQDWLEGAAPVPSGVYLKALDLVALGPFWTAARKKRTYQ